MGMSEQNKNVYPHTLTIIENEKRNILDFDGNTDKNSKILKTQLKLPKSLIQSIEFIVFISNRTQNELFTEFLIHELDTYLYDPSSVILSIVEKSGFLELIGHGLKKYFGEEIQTILESDIVSNVESLKWKSMNLELILNTKIIGFIEKYCKLTKISKAEFIAFLILARLDCIRTCPEIILDYMKNSDKFFQDLKEGVKEYYGKIISQKEKHQNGGTHNAQ